MPCFDREPEVPGRVARFGPDGPSARLSCGLRPRSLSLVGPAKPDPTRPRGPAGAAPLGHPLQPRKGLWSRTNVSPRSAVPGLGVELALLLVLLAGRPPGLVDRAGEGAVGVGIDVRSRRGGRRGRRRLRAAATAAGAGRDRGRDDEESEDRTPGHGRASAPPPPT